MPYVAELQTFPDLSDDEIKNFAEAALAIYRENGAKTRQDNEYRIKNGYMTPDLLEVFDSYTQAGVKLAKFTSIPLEQIPDWERFTFVKQVFPYVNAMEVRILFMDSGKLVTPHVDQATRKYVLNFPIQHFEDSRTNFYKALVDVKRMVFRAEEIELAHSFQYKPKTLYILDTHVPHAIELGENEPRIMLSYTILGKPEYQKFVEKL